MITRDMFRHKTITNIRSGTVDVHVDVRIGKTKEVESNPAEEERAVQELTDGGMEFLYGDIRRAIHECRRDVLYVLYRGAIGEHAAIAAAFQKLLDVIPK